MHSANFFSLLLEFFWHWGETLPEENPKTSAYCKFYRELVEAGVTFPQKFRFISSNVQIACNSMI